MKEFLAVFDAVLPVLGIVAAGFAIRRLNWLSEEADGSLMRVVVNLLTPCLVADTILGNTAFTRAGNLWLPPILGFVTTVGGILAGLATRRWLGAGNVDRQDRTYALAVGLCNYGYIPLPLAQMLFTQRTVGVLFVQNVGVELAMWLFGLAVLSGRSWRQGWRHVVNPPVIAILGTLALNALVRREALPAPLLRGAHLLGQCAIPLGLILIGATIADLYPELRSRRGLRTGAVACVVRLVLLPALILALAVVLPASPEVKQVLALHAAMPAGVFSIIMARHYGGDAGTALRVVVATSLVSVLTMPVWLRLGMALIGG